MPNLLRTLYFAIFESQRRYGCQIWGQQKSQHITDINDLHQKTIKIINSKSKYSRWKPLLKESSIIAFSNVLRSENCLLVLKQINQASSTNLKNIPHFQFNEKQHTHNTRTANNWQVSFSQVNTTNYELYSVTQTLNHSVHSGSFIKLQKIGIFFKTKSNLTSLKIIYHRINS